MDIIYFSFYGFLIFIWENVFHSCFIILFIFYVVVMSIFKINIFEKIKLKNILSKKIV